MTIKALVPLLTLCLAIFSLPVQGATLQVSEDSYAVDSTKMNGTSGKSHLLEVSPLCPAYLRFDVGDFSKQIPAGDVTGARLTFYIAKRRVAGALAIHRVMSEWTESPSGNRNLPSHTGDPLALLHAPALREGQFAVIDVTDLVKRWLASPDRDLGLAIVADDKAIYLIPSKEGPEKGLSATLEIDHHPRVENSRIAEGLNAAKLGDGKVNNAEFASLNGVIAPIQGQLDAQGTKLDGANADIGKLEDDLADLDATVTGLGSDLTNLATSSAGKVNKAGDTMSGILQLPADGLKVGTNQFVLANGNTGVGTADPQSKLDVRGSIRLGATGEDFATGGEENLRIIRGSLNWDLNKWSVTAGKGFTMTRNTAGNIVLTFTQPFASTPSMTASQYGLISGIEIVALDGTKATLGLFSSPNNPYSVHFIFTGPR